MYADQDCEIMMDGLDQDEKILLAAEELSVTKQQIVSGRVRVSTVTHEHEELVNEMLSRERVEIERTPIGKEITSMPSVRNEGDTIIVPVVEEHVVIERRLILKEEVRIRRVRETENYRDSVTLRKQEAVITHIPSDTITDNQS